MTSNGANTSSIIERIKERARSSLSRVVLAESDDDRILRTAASSRDQGIAQPILLGTEGKIRSHATELGLSLRDIELHDPSSSVHLSAFIREYCAMRQQRGITEAVARRILTKPLYFGCMMVRMGLADAAVAGASTATANVIKASHLILGLRSGISTPSSFFLMETRNAGIGESGVLVYADAAVNPDPTSEQLADIAISAADSVRALLGWEPRVAMLSFSTKGSATHPLVDKVTRATEIVRQKAPWMKVDGELQVDAALAYDVARRKMKDLGSVAGRANVLIFPDLDAGNISYKITQYVAGANAYGPILQGFNKPVSDLSRGATVDDIVVIVAILSVLAQASGHAAT